MKRIFQLALIFASLNIYGQLVITEISYNPPEAGSDSLEYVELFNNSGSTIDLTGYTFSDGFDFTFVDGSIANEEYVVIANNKEALSTVFSDAVIFEWTSGALNNSGETITLMDNLGNVIDQVIYDDGGGWPTSDDGTDGEGASIILCDPNADNSVGENWSSSSNTAGTIINDKEIFGSAGSSNVCSVGQEWRITANGDRTFSPNELVVKVGDRVVWENVSGFHNVNGSQDTYPNNPEGFINGDASTSAWSFEYVFNVPGVYQYQCDPHITANMTGKITVVDPTVGLKIDQIDFNIYPNPVTNLLIIECDEAVNRVEVYSVFGQKVLESHSNEVNMVSLSSGNYAVKVYTNKGVAIKMVSKN